MTDLITIHPMAVMAIGYMALLALGAHLIGRRIRNGKQGLSQRQPR